MSLESSIERGTDEVHSKRARFAEWRQDRPFAGGVLLLLAGLLIGWVPTQFAFELMLVGGSYTFIGLAWAIGVFLTGAFVLYRPELSTILGVVGVVLSILSLLGALGGLLVGMFLGIVGGNLCVAWSGPAQARDDGSERDEGDGGDDGDGSLRDEREGGHADGGFQFGEERSRESGESRRAGDPGGSGQSGRSERSSGAGRSLRSGGPDSGRWRSRLAGVPAALAGLVRRRFDPATGDDVSSDDVASSNDDVISRGRTRLVSAFRNRRRQARRLAGEIRQSDLRDVRRAELQEYRPSDLRTRVAAAPRRVVDAATTGDPTRRLAVVVALLVVTAGTLTLVTTLPAAAILGDSDRVTYTVDVGEIQLGDDGRICAASLGGGGYRVVITDATLVDTAIYQERNGEVVKSTFPSVEVDDAMAMYTSGEGERLGLLATTVGCTREDQTTRTVFRNRYQASSMLRSGQGVSMAISDNPNAVVPQPGGFQFVAPGGNNETATGDVTNVTDGVTDVFDDDPAGTGNDGAPAPGDAAENATTDPFESIVNETGNDGSDERDDLRDRLENATDDGDRVPDRLGNATEGIVDDPPENLSEVVDRMIESFENATAAFENATGGFGDAGGVAPDPGERLENATDEPRSAAGDLDTAGGDASATPVADGDGSEATPSDPDSRESTATPEESGVLERVFDPDDATPTPTAVESTATAEQATETTEEPTATAEQSTETEPETPASTADSAGPTETESSSGGLETSADGAASTADEGQSTPAEDAPTATPGDENFELFPWLSDGDDEAERDGSSENASTGDGSGEAEETTTDGRNETDEARETTNVEPTTDDTTTDEATDDSAADDTTTDEATDDETDESEPSPETTDEAGAATPTATAG